MRQTLYRARLKFGLERPKAAEGPAGIAEMGHRRFVGGLWEEMGRFQFDLMLAQGLRPDDVFCDVGCGSLRGGALFVPYLDAGNYLGLDLHQQLLDAGLAELGPEIVIARQPELVASDCFDFSRFSKRPTVALAQSLFSHLAAADITDCLTRLRAQAADGCRFFGTFFLPDGRRNPRRSHSQLGFTYTPEAMREMGERTGWSPRYIGDIGHERGQVLMEYTAS